MPKDFIYWHRLAQYCFVVAVHCSFGLAVPFLRRALAGFLFLFVLSLMDIYSPTMACWEAQKLQSTIAALLRTLHCLGQHRFELSCCAQSHCLVALQEIKEVAEKRRHSDEGQGVLTLSVAAPYVTRVAAELTYDYKDRYSPPLRPLSSPPPNCPIVVQSMPLCLPAQSKY